MMKALHFYMSHMINMLHKTHLLTFAKQIVKETSLSMVNDSRSTRTIIYLICATVGGNLLDASRRGTNNFGFVTKGDKQFVRVTNGGVKHFRLY